MDAVLETLAWLRDQSIEFAKNNAYVVGLAIWALVRACGTTVQSGTTGLLYSFGRTKGEIPPGFKLLLPFLQIVRTVPTRSRTLDLPAQRVATHEGLVYHVDANLVYRVVDVRRALVEVDDLVEGMTQMLGLSVQEVLRARRRAELRRSDDLDQALSGALTERLLSWGVVVERAGFPSITPSRETLRLTQLNALAGERERARNRAVDAGAPSALATVLAADGPRVVRRSRLAAAAERTAARRRAARKLVARIQRVRQAAGNPLDGRVAARARARAKRAAELARPGLGAELLAPYSASTAR